MAVSNSFFLCRFAKIFCLLILILNTCFAQQGGPSAFSKDTAAISAMIKTANLNPDPDSCIFQLKKAAQKSIDISYPLGATNALIAIGSKYSDLGKYTEASQYANKALPYAERSGDRQQLAFCYNLFGVISIMQGDYPKASGSFFKGLEVLQPVDATTRRGAVTIYTNLAVVHGRLGQNDKKLNYLSKAEELARQMSVPPDVGNILLAGILINKGNYYTEIAPDTALKYFQQVLDITSKIDPQKNTKGIRSEALALVNSGAAYLQKKEYEKAASYCLRAIDIAGKKYAYVGVQGKYTLADAYRNLKRYKEAEDTLLSALREDRTAKRKDQVIVGYNTLQKLYRDIGQYDKAFNSIDTLLLLKDSLLSAEKAQSVNQMDVRFKTDEKDKQIAAQQLKISKQKMWMTIIICSILVLLLVTISFYRFSHQKQTLQLKQMKLMEQEHKIDVLKTAVHSEDNERSRIARELHDGIGGMLSAAMMRFSAMAHDNEAATQLPDYRAAVNILSEMGDEIRKTAHNLMPDVLLKQQLPEAVQAYCTSMQDDALQIDFQSYGPFGSLGENFKLNIYRIIQELLKNIQQHAHANQALVQLQISDNVLSVTVEDNGTGFNIDEVKHGIGLHNLRTRVNSLDGRFTLRSLKGEGTSVFIEFDLPIA